MTLKLFQIFFKKIKNKKFNSLKLPKFDKSIDDRCNKRLWYNIKSRPDVIILEGWCVWRKSSKKIHRLLNQ